MNKYTTLLQKYLKIIFFLTLVLGLFFGIRQLFHASHAMQEVALNDAVHYKSEFFLAMQEHDLAKARTAYEHLKPLLPENDTFLTEIAPAYMADLYLKYAQTLNYDPDSYNLMVEQARQLSPNHPKLLVMKPVVEAEVVPEPSPAPVPEPSPSPVPESTPAPVPAPTPPPVPNPKEASIRGIPLSQQFPSSDVEDIAEPEPDPEPYAEIKDGPPRIPYIDPPPLTSTLDHLMEPPRTSDPCALSFYSKESPLTACIDALAPNRYGPAMFVIGKDEEQPLLAFTQAALSYQEYEAYCEMGGSCPEAADETPALIDLSEVENTLQDYNAYCQMTGSCSKITGQVPKHHKPLTRAQVQAYAQWLSEKTGYSYRLPREQDAVAIQVYFQHCVDAKTCQPALLDSLGKLLSQPESILVREVLG